MANALGFGGAGNKNQGFSGTTGGGQVYPLQMKMGKDGQLGLVDDGSGGTLNYLNGAVKTAAPAIANAVGSGASTVGGLLGGL